MSDKEQPQGSGGKTASTPSSGARPGWFVVLPALTLVVGLVLGGLIAGVALDGSDTGEDASSDPTSAESPSTDPTSAESPSVDPDEPSATGGLEVVVPQECLDAADTVEEAAKVLRDGVDAIENFEREPLLDVLNRLEDLEAEAREQADRCSDVEVNQSP